MHTDDVTRWAVAAAAGDGTAAAAFVRATQAEVWRLCAHLVDRGSADDLTQETYLRAWRALPSYAGASSARTWLLAIARNTAVDAIRAATRARRLQSLVRRDLGQVPDVAETVAADDLLTGLAPERREAFVLTQLLGLSYSEAAEVAGCPVGTIRSRVARARDDLIGLHGAASAL